jgi:hypothetical protein
MEYSFKVVVHVDDGEPSWAEVEAALLAAQLQTPDFYDNGIQLSIVQAEPAE